ncbi:ATP-binding protein [Flexibacterium corallicola]|uniref:ATP-binding protein n=1 Tax=Flexibacterium corallicola TaxID=3037259 RepID=UPI00286EE011|nr:ATP-binding protein [Pseudovibrio sp. M1P-2-3]
MVGQLLLIILATVLVAQFLTFMVFRGEHSNDLVDVVRENALWGSASVVKLVEDTPESLQAKVLKAISNRRARYFIDTQPIIKRSGDKGLEQALKRRLNRSLDGQRPIFVSVNRESSHFFRDENRSQRERFQKREGYSLRKVERKLGLYRLKEVQIYISVQLKNGGWLNIVSHFNPPRRPLLPALLPVIILATLITLVIWVFIARLIRPLRSLEKAAEQFGRGHKAETLKEGGPLEVKTTIAAFNLMQERLSSFVKSQTRMIAAISHDLRTPITSLRIRAEFIENSEDRKRIIATLDEMQAITEASLSFAKDNVVLEEVRRVNIGELVETIVEDYVAMGKDVTLVQTCETVISARISSLKRTLRNVIDNAIRYGICARVKVAEEKGRIVIEVIDEGPGIPEEKREEVFEPFYRLETSRNEKTGGIGLGLAICRNIISAHGGTINLKNNRAGKGLIVIISLPI